MKSNGQFRSWTILITAALFFSYEVLQFALFNTLSSNLVQDFNINGSQLSQVAAFYLYASIALVIPTGLLLDRFSTRALLITTGAICVFGTYLVASAHGITQLSAGRFLTGIGNTFALLGGLRLASGWFPAEKRDLARSIVFTLGMVGGVIAQTPSALLIQAVGWREAMLMNAALGGLIFVAMILFVRNVPTDSSTARDRPNFLKDLKEVLCNSQAWLCGAYAFFLNLPMMLFAALWGNMYLHQVHGLSPTASSTISSLIYYGVMVGSPLLGILANKTGRKPLMLTSGLLSGLSVILTLFLAKNIVLVGILFFLSGVSTGGQIFAYSIAAEQLPARLESTASAFVALLVNLGVAIIQVILGMAIQSRWSGEVREGVAWYSQSDYQSTFGTMGVALLASILFAHFVRERQQEPRIR